MTTLEPGRPVEGVFAVRRKERRMSRKGSPYLALTLGDPAGVGPEIIAAAWRALSGAGTPFAVIGDARLTVAQQPAGSFDILLIDDQQDVDLVHGG